MNHNRIASSCLKYLNIVFGILMLVVFCLNLESIIHNNAHDHIEPILKRKELNFAGHVVNEEAYDILSQRCIDCHQSAVHIITGLNIKGAILSVFLATFSFIFAFKLEVYMKYCILFVPLSILTALTTTIYFIFIYLHTETMPAACLTIDTDRKCDPDFSFYMEYKILPYSFLMLVLVPQILTRAAERIFVKVCYDEKQSSKYQAQFYPKKLNSVIYDKGNEENKYEFGFFRELPVDCPSYNISMNSMSDRNLNNNENKGFNAELTECYKLPEGLEDDQITAEVLNNSQLATNFPSRRHFVKSTSLSTIAEEKTLNNNTLQSSVLKSANQSDSTTGAAAAASVNGRVVIQKMLDEFKNKNTFINEIMHVFEPSSKEGTFNRNVPIRFSSPLKYNKEKLDTSASLSLTSLCTHSTDMSNQSKLSVSSPISHKSQKIYSDLILNNLVDENNNTAQWNSLNNSSSMKSSNINQCVAKKIRLVKRLKNRIETKSGQKLQFSVPKLNSTSSLNFKIKNTIENKCPTSPYTLRNISIGKGDLLLAASPSSMTHLPKIQLSALEKVEHVYENHNTVQYLSDNVVYPNNNNNTNRSFVIDTSIEPVYF